MTDGRTVFSVDARGTSEPVPVAVESTAADVDAAVTRAHAASATLARASRADRARLLRSLASAMDEDGAKIIAAADRETALGTTRLTGELARTVFQLRHFAEVIEDGVYLSATIDHADANAAPVARPDIRRMHVPLGPVAVFSASNFPLAFSVPGGDTASAIAAGNAVVVKAHSGHPLTSALSAEALRRGATEAGFPADVVAVVYGTQAGVALVQHPLIAAASFTGSVTGGRALFDLANGRPIPIPFFGELGSLNAFVVTEQALAERSEEIATGLAASFTFGMGQLCTKPGLALVPTGDAGDAFCEAVRGAAMGVAASPLLNARIRSGWIASIAALGAAPGIETLIDSSSPDEISAGVSLYSASAETVIAAGSASPAFEECFGPSTLIVRYANESELTAVLALVPGSLTGTVHGGSSEGNPATTGGMAFDILSARSGRVLWNQFPTGVSVTWAMQHGGPYPATTSSATTSVGAAAILRFVRAVAFQNTPQELLPPELRDDNPSAIPRRFNGRLEQ